MGNAQEKREAVQGYQWEFKRARKIQIDAGTKADDLLSSLLILMQTVSLRNGRNNSGMGLWKGPIFFFNESFALEKFQIHINIATRFQIPLYPIVFSPLLIFDVSAVYLLQSVNQYCCTLLFPIVRFLFRFFFSFKLMFFCFLVSESHLGYHITFSYHVT